MPRTPRASPSAPAGGSSPFPRSGVPRASPPGGTFPAPAPGPAGLGAWRQQDAPAGPSSAPAPAAPAAPVAAAGGQRRRGGRRQGRGRGRGRSDPLGLQKLKETRRALRKAANRAEHMRRPTELRQADYLLRAVEGCRARWPVPARQVGLLSTKDSNLHRWLLGQFTANANWLSLRHLGAPEIDELRHWDRILQSLARSLRQGGGNDSENRSNIDPAPRDLAALCCRPSDRPSPLGQRSR